MSLYVLDDVGAALSNFRGWSYLARKQIELEHRRTWIGSAWIMLAFGMTSAGIGVLMSELQGLSFQTHVPYVLFGFVAWNFISTAVTGGCNTIINAKSYLLQMPTARSVFVMSAVLRNFYLMLIQLFTSLLIAAAFGWRPNMLALMVIPAMTLFFFAAFGSAMLLGLICARFRDLGRLIEAAMRLSFFFTPIIWTAESGRGTIGGLIGAIMTWNPFAYILRIFRDGLLGFTPDPIAWAVTAAISVVLLGGGVIALQLAGRRVTYWL